MDQIKKVQISEPRRTKMCNSAMGINAIHKTRPWVIMWCSALMPGFGHIRLGMYVKGILFLSMEIILNYFGHINLSILYTFIGQFHKAQHVLDYKSAFLYTAIWTFSIWDSYRLSVEINKATILESSQKIRDMEYNSIKSYDINVLDKRNPWVAMAWSVIFTGLGHIYSHKILTGFILVGWAYAIAFLGNLPLVIMHTFTGQWDRIPREAHYQWILFFPSIYLFGIYDAYSSVVANNKMFKEEQIYYLLGKYEKNKIKLKKKTIFQRL